MPLRAPSCSGEPTTRPDSRVLLFTCVAHVVLGLILFLSERRLWGSALAEAVLPLVITVLVLA